MAFNPTLETNIQPTTTAQRPSAVGAVAGLLDNLGAFTQKAPKAPPSPSDVKAADRATFFGTVNRANQLIATGQRDQGMAMLTTAYRDGWVGKYGVGTDPEVDQAFSAITGTTGSIGAYNVDNSMNALRSSPDYMLGMEFARQGNPNAPPEELDVAAMNYVSRKAASTAEIDAVKTTEGVTWTRARGAYDEGFNLLVKDLRTMSDSYTADGVIDPNEAQELRGWYTKQLGKFTAPPGVDPATWKTYYDNKMASTTAVLDAQINEVLSGNPNEDIIRATTAMYDKLIVDGKLPPFVRNALTIAASGDQKAALEMLATLHNTDNNKWMDKINMVVDMSYEELKDYSTSFEDRGAEFLDSVDTTDWLKVDDGTKVDSLTGADRLSVMSDDNTTALVGITNIIEKVAALPNTRLNGPLLATVFDGAFFNRISKINAVNPTIGAALIERTNAALAGQQTALDQHVNAVANRNGFSLRVVTDAKGNQRRDLFPDPTLVSPEAQAEVDKYFGGSWAAAQRANGFVLQGAAKGAANATPNLTRMFAEIKGVQTELNTYDAIEKSRQKLNGELPTLDMEQPEQPQAPIVQGSGGADASTPEWQKANLAEITASNGERWQVNRQAATAFQGFINELESMGYAPMSSGGYNYRNIRGSNRLSEHATGNAIDINATANPMGGTANDFPPNVSAIAAKYGLAWGGDWKTRPDPMHFEFIAGRAGGATQAPPTNGDVAMLAPTGPIQSDFTVMANANMMAEAANAAPATGPLLSSGTMQDAPGISVESDMANPLARPAPAAKEESAPVVATPMDPEVAKFVASLTGTLKNYASVEELQAAVESGAVKAGTLVLVNGQPMMASNAK